MAEEQSSINYKAVPGFPGYRVGDDGSVWSCRSNSGRLKDVWHQLHPAKDRDGYRRVALGLAQRQVHRLILEVFVGPCPDGMQCLHEDGNPDNNALSNLRWGAQTENEADKRRHGRLPIGEQHPNAILDADKVRAIRHARATTNKTLKQIGDEHGVSLDAVYLVVKRRNWKHVD